MHLLKNKKFIFALLLVAILVSALTIGIIAYVPSVTDVSVELYDNVRSEEFSIENAAVLIKYKNGDVKSIGVTKDMLSEEDNQKLFEPGRHDVTINYKKRKSISAQVNLLRDVKKEKALDMIIKGIQKTAVNNNINGELEFSAFYEMAGQPRKDYTVSLKFTLDIDKGGEAKNYLGLEITEDKNVLLGVYYQDDTQSRPYIYLKSDGPFIGFFEKNENKFRSVSADEFFGEAKELEEDQYWTYQDIWDKVRSLLRGNTDDLLVKSILELLLADAAIADDGSAATININFNTALQLIRLGSLLPGVSDLANNFLNSISAGFNFNEAAGGITKPPLLRLRALFDADGCLKSMEIADFGNNKTINNALQLNLDGKISAAINVEKVSIKADDSYFTLPTDKGLEQWEESELSFERWVIRNRPGEFYRPTKRDGIEEYLDINYIGDDNIYHQLDVYRPEANAGEKLPVIINIHGGGWVQGSKEGSYRYCQALALQGFAVVNINYHLLPDRVLPEPIQDIFAVFNFVMDEENAETYGFDNQNVFLTGDSAGGHYTMLSLSILADEELMRIYGVESDIRFKAAGVNSTGFSFTEVLKIPLPYAHFYVNQFFSDELPYTAYRDDPRYIDMAKSLNIENNKIEDFPPMFVSSAYGDFVQVHSERLVNELEKRGVEYVYDFRDKGDADNPENNHLVHDFNINAPDWTVSRAVNEAMCAFFMSHVS